MNSGTRNNLIIQQTGPPSSCSSQPEAAAAKVTICHIWIKTIRPSRTKPIWTDRRAEFSTKSWRWSQIQHQIILREGTSRNNRCRMNIILCLQIVGTGTTIINLGITMTRVRCRGATTLEPWASIVAAIRTKFIINSPHPLKALRVNMQEIDIRR